MGTYYKEVAQFIDAVDPSGAWVEIGVDRGEGSTKFFADMAKTKGVKFYGVDADENQISRARAVLSSQGQMVLGTDGQFYLAQGTLPDHIELSHAFGENFLEQFVQDNPGKKFSLVYLDNFDWDYWVGGQEESFVPAQKQHYRDYMGTEMTNINSQKTHLLQAMRLMPLMTENSIIVCDDTWYHPNEGVFIGKCSAVIPYLLLQGYEVLNSQGYRQNSGAILGRFNKRTSSES
jgi:hypothetical protein